MNDNLIGLTVRFVIPAGYDDYDMHRTYEGRVMSKVRTNMIFKGNVAVADAYVINATIVGEDGKVHPCMQAMLKLCKPEWLTKVISAI
ncbi:hypothetical protein MA9V2_125 [Chryseobacterium phage MA9V-2]|nr:hypothetical protein MA9V2_125 [Chryseobacterium phage MA9V-2]